MKLSLAWVFWRRVAAFCYGLILRPARAFANGRIRLSGRSRKMPDIMSLPELKRSFPPVLDAQVRLLLLGSLPGAVSLAHSRYYAHPQNQFWRLIGAVIGEDLHGMDYAPRLQTLLRHHIGLWDVVAQASREGSLDRRIRDHTGNDILALVQTLPHLQAIGFNGGTAAKIGLRQLGAAAAGYQILQLPSSSPAYTVAFETKRAAWSVLKECLG
jgi:hypoxanthine-DNA glycosylase